MKPTKLYTILTLTIGLVLTSACREKAVSDNEEGATSQETQKPVPSDRTLRGASGYTPYDWCSLLWAQAGGEMVWVSSGAEAGKLLISKADVARRPDWAFCSQGVVAALTARGEHLTILATLYVSADAVRPVFRKPKPLLLVGTRSLFIPRSSIELAFDRLLAREGLKGTDIKVPHVENPSFTTIVSLLSKPVTDSDALDFGILVEPHISNLLSKDGALYEIGQGGLYELCYCLVAREEDIARNPEAFVSLLRSFDEQSKRVELISNEEEFYDKVWGRKNGADPERLPKLITFDRQPARLELDAKKVRQLIKDEITVLVSKYPNDLRLPENFEKVVDETLLRQVAPNRVKP